MGKRIVTIEAKSLDVNNILPLVQKGCMVRIYFDRSFLLIEERTDRFYGTGSVKQIRIVFMEHACEDGRDLWKAFQTQYFPISQPKEAVECFIDRAKSDKPHRANRGGISLQEISNQQKV